MKGLRRMLGGRHREQRVRQRLSPRGAAGGLGQAGRVRVEADDQRLGPRRRSGEHGAAVTRAQVDRDPRVARGELGESADVDFGEAAARHDAEHGGSVAGRRAARHRGSRTQDESAIDARRDGQ